jgi:hypothetical protein
LSNRHWKQPTLLELPYSDVSLPDVPKSDVPVFDVPLLDVPKLVFRLLMFRLSMCRSWPMHPLWSLQPEGVSLGRRPSLDDANSRFYGQW